MLADFTMSKCRSDEPLPLSFIAPLSLRRRADPLSSCAIWIQSRRFTFGGSSRVLV
jgi:hypothetical protein